MRYSKLLSCDTNNGSGFRVTLFVSGCTINCYNCQNKLAQNFNFGFRYTDETKEKILKLMSKPYIKGFSLLGGEPFDNLKDGQLLDLLKEIKKLYPKKTVFCWSGYTFEEIFKQDIGCACLPCCCFFKYFLHQALHFPQIYHGRGSYRRYLHRKQRIRCLCKL